MSAEDLSYDHEQEVAGFIAKTFQILNNEGYSKIIYWGASGKDFVIKDVNRFQEIVLPAYFRHKKINSFIRQLNMYGFHKSRKDNSKSIFSHPNFIKGREDLLPTIKRKIRGAEDIIKTPQKPKNSQVEKEVPETAVKEQTIKKFPNEQTQNALKAFLESRQFLNSRIHLNLSFKELSMNEFVDQSDSRENEEEDEKISIQLEIDKKEEDIGEAPKILNPSYFFNSFKDYQLK